MSDYEDSLRTRYEDFQRVYRTTLATHPDWVGRLLALSKEIDRLSKLLGINKSKPKSLEEILKKQSNANEEPDSTKSKTGKKKSKTTKANGQYQETIR